MCGGGGGSNAAAESAAQQQAFLQAQQDKADAKEAKRQADIISGTRQINDAYAGYTQNYYDSIARDYSQNYAKPQIDLQQKRDMLQSKFGLARSGISNSSAAAKEIGDIGTIYGQTATDAANRGLSLAQDRQTQVNASRNAALQQLQASDQPGSTIANAVQGATAYKISPAAVALTDLLSNAAGAINRSYQNNMYSGGQSGGLYSPFQKSQSAAGGSGTTKVKQ